MLHHSTARLKNLFKEPSIWGQGGQREMVWVDCVSWLICSFGKGQELFLVVKNHFFPLELLFWSTKEWMSSYRIFHPNSSLLKTNALSLLQEQLRFVPELT